MNATKPWYKKWWGIIIVISFFPILVPYLIWTETKWSTAAKIAITAVCLILFIGIAADSEQRQQESLQVVAEAQSLIHEGNLDQALIKLKQAQAIYPIEDNNPAFALEESIEKVNSDEFTKESIISLSDEEAQQLENGNLTKRFIDNSKLNELFLINLKEHLDQRSTYLLEITLEERKEDILKRNEQIQSQFSVWDGSHIKLTRLIKESMNDPSTFEHVSSNYTIEGENLIITTTFRGSNAFGAIVKNTVVAKANMDGDIIEILEE